MKGTFGDGIDTVEDHVGKGHLVGTIEVDQVYAHYQHDPTLDLHHPDGGGPNYITNTLFSRSDERMQAMADNLLPGDATLEDGMRDAMERMSQDVYDNAPWEFDDLRNSGHPQVSSDGAIVYDRSPVVPRLTDDELKQKARLSRELDPDRYKQSGAERHAKHTSGAEHPQVAARKAENEL